MNPNASSFSFSGGAPLFVPGQIRGAPRGPPQGQPIQESWDDEQPTLYQGDPGAGAGGGSGYGQQYQQQQQYYQQQQNGGHNQGQMQQQSLPGSGTSLGYGYQQPAQPQAQAYYQREQPSHLQPPQPQAQPKTISIGAPKTAAALNTNKDAGSSTGSNNNNNSNENKSSTISLSIGSTDPANTNAGPSKLDSKVASEPSSSNGIPSTVASTSTSTPASSSTPTRAPTPSAATPTLSATTPSPAKKKEDKEVTSIIVGPPAVKVERTADQIAEQIAAAAAQEDVQDLYGADGELLEQKDHVNVVFIGHVDAGKSTMGGQILVQCGMVDKRTLEKYEKEAKEAGRESWYLSWALDSTPQERLKGKTVEVGRAYFETEKRRYTILDAPGHKGYIPSMISGAAQADIAILVISARKGEFETGFERGGQTREHVMLVKTAGVQKIVVAINKMDESTVQWSKERYDEIVGKLSPFLKGAGYNPKTEVTFIPVSGYTGSNIKTRADKSVQSFYDGPGLLEHLDELPVTDRKINAPFMMPISEKYKDMGTIIVGKIESGRVRRGDSVLLMPNKLQVEITAIYAENEEEVPQAMSGDNVRFRLRGIDDEDVNVGFVVADLKKPVRAVQHFEAQLIILDHKNIICAGYSAIMHVHTLSEEINLAALLHYYDKKTGRKSRRPPQFAKKGQKIVALIEATAPVCIERFDDYPQLGRFTLRDEGKTIAIGKVTKLIDSAEELPDMAKMSIATAGGASMNGS